MIEDLIFGGFLIDAAGNRHQLPVVMAPTDSVIDEAVKKVVGAGMGILGIEHRPQLETGPYEIVLYVDAGNFLLMLNEYADDGEHLVRTLTNNEAPNDLISILGEKYPAKAVIGDMNFVCSILKEFAATGNVSADLLS